MGFFTRFFRKKEPLVASTFYEDWAKEQIARIRRGESVMWLPGTRPEIVVASAEIDRLNAKLDEEEPR